MGAPLPAAPRDDLVIAAEPGKDTLARRSQLGEDLAENLAEDLEGCFELLVLSFQDELFRFAVGMTGEAGAGQEVVQDAFVNAYRALRTYDADRVRSLALRPWLYRITLNLCRNLRRSRRPELDFPERMPDPPDAAPGPEAIALREDERARLAGALARLPVQLRAATVLKYGRDLSYTEIAELLDAPLGTVKANVHRGIAALRSRLNHEGQELMP
ncbi:MAG: hypothetical protein NVSMB29_06810 [Candidatus Dormibacteria bacterium]